MKALFLKEAEAEQGLSDRRRYLAAPSSGRSHQDSLYILALRLDNDAHARVRCAGLGRESNHVTVEPNSATTLRVSSMRSVAQAVA